MSLSEENELLKTIIETQASRIREQEATIKELREMVDELRSLKANLEETLNEFRRQFFGDTAAVRPDCKFPKRAQIRLDGGRFPLVTAQIDLEFFDFLLCDFQLLSHGKNLLQISAYILPTAHEKAQKDRLYLQLPPLFETEGSDGQQWLGFEEAVR